MDKKQKTIIILATALVILSVWATLIGLKTIETTNRLQNSVVLLSEYACQTINPSKTDANSSIDWERMRLYCNTPEQTKSINLLRNPARQGG